ncbi:ecdysteroid 22-kinase family protein [Blastococcus sp. CCUG 61487]|uniref:ecdysteroid 22-kinase family protein n=1 Tax=Blastococcus sp. CCUG 61487 TaxID=1840703 RepID=UPI00113C36D6|nr:ecdysteroid 22-kinase family protein [Blastococcus sp. CCUG 61487]TKJ22175.1 hypothetical protein A6V29_06490 [Blastococcus sp. CCUG 61487]
MGVESPLSSIRIPRVLDDVTFEWCAQHLEPIFRATLIDADIQPVGAGRIGTTVRVRLIWASERAASPPPSVVVKLVAQSAVARRAARTFGSYRAEVGFYLELAEHVGSRLPRCFIAAYESADRYCLVLEDMGDSEAGDQMRGCSPEEAEASLLELARLHASTSASSGIDIPSWLTPRRAIIESHEALTLAVRLSDRFWARFDDRLAPEVEEALTELAVQCDQNRPRLATLTSVLHGDFRTGNLLYGIGRPVVVDWQTVAVGNSVADLSYFVGTSISREKQRADHAIYIDTYVSALRSYGIQIDEQLLWADYARYALAGLAMAIVGWSLSERTPASDEMFAVMADRSAIHADELRNIS